VQFEERAGWPGFPQAEQVGGELGRLVLVADRMIVSSNCTARL